MQYRQGDVLIERVKKSDLPKSARPVPLDRGRVILAYGEATGHAHIVKGEDVQLMARNPRRNDEMAIRYLLVGGNGAKVVHDEHSPIELTPGLHRITRQREYTPPGRRPVQRKRPSPSPSFRPVYD